MSLTSPFCYPDKMYRSSHYILHFSSSFMKQLEYEAKYYKFKYKQNSDELLMELYEEILDDGYVDLLIGL